MNDSPADQSQPPEFVGRYRIIRRLGEGGMGSVFLALDTVLRREVALKLPLTGTENDPDVRERFLREARSAATLDHPYICRVYDADEVDGRLYLAMAYIEGNTLADLVRAEGIPPRQVVALIGKLAIALNEAHLKGVVHRDLKPRNVMIRTVGSKREPVIVDFGLARFENREDERMTKIGQIMGTPAYMSPEQLRGNPDEIGPPTDIYALGVILYELLTGQIPFSGASYPVLIAQILTRPPQPPSAVLAGIDPALDRICLKALAKDVSERHASMMELATALTDYLRARPATAIVDRPIAPMARPIERDSIATGADTLVSQFLGHDAEDRPSPIQIDLRPAPRVPARPGRSWPGVRIALAILGVLALAGIIRSFWSPENPSQKEPSTPIPTRTPAIEQGKLTPPPRSSPESKNPDPPLQTSQPPAQPEPVVVTSPPTRGDSTPPPMVVPVPPAVVVTPPPAVTLDPLIVNKLRMKLKLIPAGDFMMGSDGSDPDAPEDEKKNGNKHHVQITQPFYIGLTEVTVGQFRRFVEATRFITNAEQTQGSSMGWDESKNNFGTPPDLPTTWYSPGFPQTLDHPVVCVSWSDATAFCDWLTKVEGQVYRLPTEAEWEYCCRAGTPTLYFSGNDPESMTRFGNVADAALRQKCPAWSFTLKANDGYVFTAPVGQFQPNAFGLFDMHGNVLEWCQDWYGNAYYARSPEADPLNTVQSGGRVFRGGCWHESPRFYRAANRKKGPPFVSGCDVGFRVVCLGSRH